MLILKDEIFEEDPVYKKITGKKVVTFSKLNVRILPNTNATTKVIGTLDKGTVINVTGVTADGWYVFIYNHSTAYVSGKYLEDFNK